MAQRNSAVGYAKRDLIGPAALAVSDLLTANAAAAAWCAEVNAAGHSEICAVPAALASQPRSRRRLRRARRLTR